MPRRIDNYIKLLNLFYQRNRLSLKTITEKCNVSERTAYRYLNALSEANIPIYYDKSMKAYRIDTYKSVALSTITAGEGCLLVFALHVLSKVLNEEYSDNIQQLCEKIINQNEYLIEEFYEYIRDIELDVKRSTSVTYLLKLALLQLSSENCKNVCISTDNRKKHNDELDVVNPKLIFDKKWKLLSLENEGTQINLSEIVKVTLK